MTMMVAVPLSVAGVAVAATPAWAQVDVSPSTAGMPGAALWNQLLGWLAQGALWGGLAAIIVGGGTWGWGHMASNYNGQAWGKRFVLGGAVGALFIGLGPTIINLLYHAASNG
jgi:hypothetical protein